MTHTKYLERSLRRLKPQVRPGGQAGMVSMMVTLILLLVITLIILGFAQISRREQRQSLDRHLSSQAFFAAESGVNDARKAILEFQAAGADIPEKDDCPTSPTDANYPFDPMIDPASSVSYSCLLVTTKLKNINVKVSNKGGSVNIPLQPTGPVAKLRINWAADSTPTQSDIATNCKSGIPAQGYFTNSTDWDCPYGVLRIDFVPTDTLSRAAMTDPSTGQKTVFLYPSQGGSAASLDYAVANGAVARMECLAATNCDVDITGFPAGNYALRLSSIYQSGTADITALDAGGDELELKNAQIQVDATGKAQDVLRRIQVRLATVPSGKTPDHAIVSGSSICKRFEISSALFRIPGDIKEQDPNNPMCKAMSAAPVGCILPKDISLTLDNSSSLKAPWGDGIVRDALYAAAKEFIDKANMGTYNHVGLASFSTGAIIHEYLTDNPDTIKTAIDNIDNSAGTEYLAGLQKSEELLMGPGTRPGVQKALVFISDGEPDEDDDDVLVRTKQLKDKGYVIYTMGLNNNDYEYEVLERMASSPDKFFDARNPDAAVIMAAQIANLINCN